jgi:hypothetical protein
VKNSGRAFAPRLYGVLAQSPPFVILSLRRIWGKARPDSFSCHVVNSPSRRSFASSESVKFWRRFGTAYRGVSNAALISGVRGLRRRPDVGGSGKVSDGGWGRLYEERCSSAAVVYATGAEDLCLRADESPTAAEQNRFGGEQS